MMSRFASLPGNKNPIPARASSSPASGSSIDRLRAKAADAAAEASGRVEFNGYISQIKVFNDWAIAKLSIDGTTKMISIKGEAIKDLEEYSEHTFTGKMTNHPKYGESLDVISTKPFVRPDAASIRKYLKTNFKGIGDSSAEKMVKHAMDNGGPLGLEALRQQILNEPWALDWTPANRTGEFNEDNELSEGANYVARDLATRIGAIHGVNHRLLKILSSYLFETRSTLPEKSNNPVSDAWQILCENPFLPMKKCGGYGFKIADAIAAKTGMDPNHPTRLAALSQYAIGQACDTEGHVYLTAAQAYLAIQKLDPRVNVTMAIQEALKSESIIHDDEFDDDRYYTPKLHLAETVVAESIAKMMMTSEPMFKGKHLSDEAIQTAFRQGKPNAKDLSLDKSQVNALRSMLTSRSRIHILTGGPGCGKTALMESTIHLLNNLQFKFCAPTGKAAKVLGHRIHMTGNSASTIHSLFAGSEEGWRVNSTEPLTGNVLVVDESSMPPLVLWKAIMEGMNDEMHLIVVGDPKQLASIEAGAVLSDMLDLEKLGINHVHLDTTHRNSGGILDVVKEVGEGFINPADRDGVQFSNGLEDAAVDFPRVMEAYLTAKDRSGIENTLLLISRRQGKEDEPGWNTTYANAQLRDICNPGGEKIPGSRLLIGDRIIIRENMTIAQPTRKDEEEPDEVRVVNGDTGTITGFEPSKGNTGGSGAASLNIRLDDGRIITFPGDAMKVLDHSYALTIHSAQGSEYKEVIGVFTKGHPAFINQNTLTTGLSRARQNLSVFAKDDDLRRIAATPMPKRNSSLTERVAVLMSENYLEDDESVERVAA